MSLSSSVLPISDYSENSIKLKSSLFFTANQGSFIDDKDKFLLSLNHYSYDKRIRIEPYNFEKNRHVYQTLEFSYFSNYTISNKALIDTEIGFIYSNNSNLSSLSEIINIDFKFSEVLFENFFLNLKGGLRFIGGDINNLPLYNRLFFGQENTIKGIYVEDLELGQEFNDLGMSKLQYTQLEGGMHSRNLIYPFSYGLFADHSFGYKSKNEWRSVYSYGLFLRSSFSSNNLFSLFIAKPSTNNSIKFGFEISNRF